MPALRASVVLILTVLAGTALLQAAEPRLEVTPQEVRAGARQAFRFTFTVGSEAIGPGGIIELVFYCKDLAIFDELIWTCPQVDRPDRAGYVEIAPSGLEPRVRKQRYLEIHVAGTTLAPGTEVEIRYDGDAQVMARELTFRARWKPGPAASWRLVPVERSPTVRVLPRSPFTAIATAPADVVAGEPFEVGISVLDRHGNPAPAYRGTVEVSSTDLQATLPPDRVFREEDGGLGVLAGVRLASPGLHRITVQDRATGRSVQTNWIEVHEGAPGLRRWFGETHFHTGAGAGYDPWELQGGDHKGAYTRLDEAFRYLRDVWRLDFGAAAEHDWGFVGERRDLVAGITDSFDEPGRFTTFHAYEWTRHNREPEGGHRVVLYAGEPGEVFASDDPRYDTQTELFAALRAQGRPAVVIPHPMWADPQSNILAVRADDLQPVMEIFSLQNLKSGDDLAFELDWGDPWSVREAWRRGFRMGVIGSSDNHIGTPGFNTMSALTQHVDGGYAVVLASRNERGALHEAIRRRRTYATTGHRALARLVVEGVEMGGVLRWSGGPPRVEGYVAGTAPLEELRLYRADRSRGFVDLAPVDLDPRPEIFAFDLSDEGWRSPGLYYVRAVQGDGEVVWTSPVWILPEGSAEAPRDTGPVVPHMHR